MRIADANSGRKDILLITLATHQSVGAFQPKRRVPLPHQLPPPPPDARARCCLQPRLRNDHERAWDDDDDDDDDDDEEAANERLFV